MQSLFRSFQLSLGSACRDARNREVHPVCAPKPSLNPKPHGPRSVALRLCRRVTKGVLVAATSTDGADCLTEQFKAGAWVWGIGGERERRRDKKKQMERSREMAAYTERHVEIICIPCATAYRHTHVSPETHAHGRRSFPVRA